MKNLQISILALTFLALSISSCKKNNDPDPSILANRTTNNWIYYQMKNAYYWTSEMPTNLNIDQAPKDFFNSLLSTEDRFSWMQDAQELHDLLLGVGKDYGMEYKLFKISSSGNVLARIDWVYANSPAALSGIKRGDLFGKVNGTQITTENFDKLLFSESTNMSITFSTVSNKTLYEGQTIALTSAYIEKNPILVDSIYTINNRNIGYFAYKNFIAGPSDNSTIYDDQVNAIFGKFKSAAVSDLVLDLRLNNGGSITSAQKLASLIIKNSTSTQDVLYYFDFNDVQNSLYTQETGKTRYLGNVLPEGNNISSTINQLVVLTSNNTASASELIINCLKPYMTVKLVGDTTLGKNVGSTSITDSTKAITIGLQPIILKIFNKNMQSDYSNGFIPDYYFPDNQLEIYPLGDLNDPAIYAALTSVCGFSLPQTLAPMKSAFVGEEISSTMAQTMNAFTLRIKR